MQSGTAGVFGATFFYINTYTDTFTFTSKFEDELLVLLFSFSFIRLNAQEGTLNVTIFDNVLINFSTFNGTNMIYSFVRSFVVLHGRVARFKSKRTESA